ncbi:AP2-containing protein [Hordeum vulgare]|nr:AP2-containing protein [Hordeum vulgare]
MQRPPHALPSKSSPLALPRAPQPLFLPRCRRATMPPRRRGTSGYCGVRTRPSATFYAEIRSGDMRLGLDTFETTDDVACAYDAAAQ